MATKTINNGIFKGETIEHFKSIDQNICEIKSELKSLNRRYWIILILLIVAVVERLPSLVSYVLAMGK